MTITPKEERKEINEFPQGKENYCPRCYFENDQTILRENCPHKVSDETRRTSESRLGENLSAFNRKEKNERLNNNILARSISCSWNLYF